MQVREQKSKDIAPPLNFPTSFGGSFAPSFASDASPSFMSDIASSFASETTPSFTSDPAQVAAQQADIAKTQAGNALLQALRQNVPDANAVSAVLAALGVTPQSGTPVQPAWFSAAIKLDFAFHLDAVPFTVLDIRSNAVEIPDLKSVSKALQSQPAQVVLGWGSLNNLDQADVTKYDGYMADIRAVVRLIRQESPTTFIWITACYATPTYKEWMLRMAPLGDGIALWNVAFFPAVDRFESILATVKPDCGNKPVMILGFFGNKPGSVRSGDHEAKMAQAIRRAQRAGFAGFVRIDQ
jgi:hypothetical protein